MDGVWAYVGMSVDILHHGHIKIIEKAASLGRVVVGLLTDEAIARHKRLPYLTYEQRLQVVGALRGVDKIVPQHEWDYTVNLEQLRPQYMVHGDDWQQGNYRLYRERAFKVMAQWGGQIIELPYTRDVSSTRIAEQLRIASSSAEVRRGALQRAIEQKGLVRIMEAHSPLSALIVEQARVEREDGFDEFDGFWSSSLTDSTLRGKPDTEALSLSSRLEAVNEIFEVTTKPLIMDADTGGLKEHFILHLRSMERLGISAAIIEDKTGLKKNSLLGCDVEQTQDSIENFCEKISAAQRARQTRDFLLIARIESLILDRGMDDARRRAEAYAEAGVDGVMIHSRASHPTEVLEFARHFRAFTRELVLVAVPTTYNAITDTELRQAGFNVSIHANHMLRASYPAMRRVAEEVLRCDRSLEASHSCLPIGEILNLIPGTR